MSLNILKLEKKIKMKIRKKSFFIHALTHKSSSRFLNNEKLEFLGDRVIGLVLSKKLFDLYPNESEGVLDKRFAKLVNRNTCALIGWSLGIQNFIIIGDKKKKITMKDEKILSDTCEALIAAIYLDRGFDYVSNFILNLWKDHIKKSYITILDSKTELQEYSLKSFKKLPVYNVIYLKGPRHNPTFKISVTITGSKQFYGFGKSKQQAELDAAKNLLKSLSIK